MKIRSFLLFFIIFTLALPVVLAQTPECADGLDNDADGLIDYPIDGGCSSFDDNTEAEFECSDGVDNDNDGLIDYPADTGCTGFEDNQESEPECADGLDNDADGLIDYPADSQCINFEDNQESASLAGPTNPETPEEITTEEADEEGKDSDKEEQVSIHNIIIKELEIESKNAMCTQVINIDLSIENIGQKEDGLLIRTSIPNLNIYKNSPWLYLEKFETYDQTFNIVLDQKSFNENTDYDVFVDAVFNDRVEKQLEVRPIKFSSCIGSEDVMVSTSVLVKSEEAETTSIFGSIANFFSSLF